MKWPSTIAFCATLVFAAPALAERLVLGVMDAQQGFDPVSGQPVVNLRLDTESARAFARFTQERVNQPIDVYVDDEVVMTPIVRNAILGGILQISGLDGVEEANEIVVRLRSGKARMSVAPAQR